MMHRKKFPLVEIIAPSGKVKIPAQLEQVDNLLKSWSYQAKFGKYLIGEHAFLANTTENRFKDLHAALHNEDSDIIWCFRGGSGASELLPLLAKSKKPRKQKIFLGFSDATALHIFFTQQWGWTTYHGPGARQPALNEIDDESIKRVKALFDNNIIQPPLLNLSGKFTGGNLSVISNMLGTPYQIKTDNKIFFLEDVNEPAYKIRRMLTQLDQAGLFDPIKTLVFGEFIHKDLQEQKLIQLELKTFSDTKNIPIRMASHIGHGKTNYVIPVN
jgi:muramoyltetrapeptide carboxypeptidase